MGLEVGGWRRPSQFSQFQIRLIQNVELDSLHVVASKKHIHWSGLVGDSAQPVAIGAWTARGSPPSLNCWATSLLQRQALAPKSISVTSSRGSLERRRQTRRRGCRSLGEKSDSSVPPRLLESRHKMLVPAAVQTQVGLVTMSPLLSSESGVA